MPRHVAVVMDGNGRWAQQRGLPRTDGHAAGEEALVDAAYGALAAGVEVLTVYAVIGDAVKQLVADKVPVNKIDEKAIRARLYHPEFPDPDLMVRTSGEFRISNYLLWEIAYSELVFTDVLWPDFRREHLYEAIREFQQRERRYGGLEK